MPWGITTYYYRGRQKIYFIFFLAFFLTFTIRGRILLLDYRNLINFSLKNNENFSKEIFIPAAGVMRGR